MVASLVTLYKKLKFITDENVGWGPVDLPEIELQTTAYWLTAEGAGAGWRRDELDVALIGAGRAIQAVAAVLLMVDPRDLGLVSQVRSPHHEAPTIYLYEAMPGGVGLSERLYARHDELVVGASELIRACPCEAGCPACTGPRLEPGVDGKALALRLLAALTVGERTAARHRMTIDHAAGVTRERRLANLRATLARPGGAAAGPDQLPARAPFSGRRSPALAGRLAAALGAGRRRDRRRLARAQDRRAGGHAVGPPASRGPPGAPAGRRPARVHRHGDDGPRDGGRHARVPGRARPLGGRHASARPSSCSPTTPTSRRCSPRWPAGSRLTRGW